MRFFLQTLLTLLGLLSATAEEKQSSSVIKPSILFRAESNSANHHPHVLKVFLRLDNVSDSEVSWVANVVSGIEAELLDADGEPVPNSPGAASAQSNARPFIFHTDHASTG